MKFEFDIDGFMDKVKDVARERIRTALEEAKSELGTEGEAIRIDDRSSIADEGDRINIAGVSFPSEDVKAKFLAIVHQKLH